MSTTDVYLPCLEPCPAQTGCHCARPSAGHLASHTCERHHLAWAVFPSPQYPTEDVFRYLLEGGPLGTGEIPDNS